MTVPSRVTVFPVAPIRVMPVPPVLILTVPETFIVVNEFPMVVIALPVVLISVCPVITVLPNHVLFAVNPWTDVFCSVVCPVPVTLRPQSHVEMGR